MSPRFGQVYSVESDSQVCPRAKSAAGAPARLSHSDASILRPGVVRIYTLTSKSGMRLTVRPVFLEWFKSSLRTHDDAHGSGALLLSVT